MGSSNIIDKHTVNKCILTSENNNNNSTTVHEYSYIISSITTSPNYWPPLLLTDHYRQTDRDWHYWQTLLCSRLAGLAMLAPTNRTTGRVCHHYMTKSLSSITDNNKVELEPVKFLILLRASSRLYRNEWINVHYYSEAITVNCCRGTVQMLWVGSLEKCCFHLLTEAGQWRRRPDTS